MVKTICEIGINHNGDIDNAKKLIDICSFANASMIKIQKRTPDICVPEEQKNKPKSTPWGEMTYLEYKNKIEFSEEECIELKQYCDNKNIEFFSSIWDIPSGELMKKISNTVKIPSALIVNDELCKYARDNFEVLIISTGMSTEKEIEKCVKLCKPDVIMHTNSTYPTPEEELNLDYIRFLKDKYKNKNIGYSCHFWGLTPSFIAAAMGVSHIEKHVTTDRSQWGSDQKSSVEPIGILKWINGIKCVDKAMQGYGPREVFASELAKSQSLRKTTSS